MKGVIFTELVKFMERVQSAEFVDAVLNEAALPNDGAFTSIGNYPSEYALKMVEIAVEKTGIEAPELCRLFGKYLYTRFTILYPHILASYKTAESLLEHVGSHIHAEVCTLYPDARPPVIEAEKDGDHFSLSYKSHRPMAAIALGLVQGCMENFGDRRTLSWDLASNGKSGSFVITPATEGSEAS